MVFVLQFFLLFYIHFAWTPELTTFIDFSHMRHLVALWWLFFITYLFCVTLNFFGGLCLSFGCRVKFGIKSEIKRKYHGYYTLRRKQKYRLIHTFNRNRKLCLRLNHRHLYRVPIANCNHNLSIKRRFI